MPTSRVLAATLGVFLAAITSASALPAGDPEMPLAGGVTKADMRCDQYGFCSLRPYAALRNPRVVRRPTGPMTRRIVGPYRATPPQRIVRFRRY